MKYLFLWLCLCTPLLLAAQSNYKEALRKGDQAFRKKAYKDARNYYFAAQAFDPSKSDVIKHKIDSLFDAIEGLKETAENALDQAKIEKQKAEKALMQVQIQKQKADEALTEIARREIASARKALHNLSHKKALKYLKNAAFSENMQIKKAMTPVLAEVIFITLHQKPVAEWPLIASFRAFHQSPQGIFVDFDLKGQLFDHTLQQAKSYRSKARARAFIFDAMAQRLGKPLMQKIRDKYYSTKHYTR